MKSMENILREVLQEIISDDVVVGIYQTHNLLTDDLEIIGAGHTLE